MSDIRAYLEEKAALPEREWLRRDPPVTHPAIMQAVRDALASGLHYDDDVERYVDRQAGDLPPYFCHGHEKRDRLTYQLGREVYLARKIVRDEESAAARDALLADGFVDADAYTFREGGRVIACLGTLYSGYTVPVYNQPVEGRSIALDNGRWALIPKGRRTRGYAIAAPALVKESR